MKRSRVCLLAALSLVVAIPAPVAAAELLSSVQAIPIPPDPLTLPAPQLVTVESLDLAPDTRRPAEKVSALLWQEAVEVGPEGTLQVIVELRAPDLDGLVQPESTNPDLLRVATVAALAHAFEAPARLAGLEGLHALSHFPLVYGVIRSQDLVTLASVDLVDHIFFNERMTAHRSQGGALMNANTLRTSLGGTGSGVGVAVLDSGIDNSHPELASRVVAQGDFTGTTGSGVIDDNGHGTACAGIIAGSGGGMAPQASLWAIKVLTAGGSDTPTSVLDGLNAVYASRNDYGGLDAINMSLGGGGPFNSDCDASSPYNSIFNSLYSAGIPVFVSSGNDGFLNGVSSPACHSKVIAVGAVTDAAFNPDPLCGGSWPADAITCYSNSGVPLDILAPSHCATTTKAGGGLEPCFNGTSAAAPYAAGVGAQILSLRPSTTPAQLRTALMTTGRPRPDVNGITRNRIDAVEAYQALAGGGGDTSPCVQSLTTACLQGGRFEIQVTYTTVSETSAARAMYFGGIRAQSNDSVFYYFFDPGTNFEMGLKVLNACIELFNYKYWVFISGLTDQGWTVRIRDTTTGQVETYTNTLGNLSTTFRDQQSFDCF